MATSFTTGNARLRLLDGAGATIKTLYLPPTNPGPPLLTWKEKLVRQELVDGGERVRRLGFIPVLKLKWKIYDDRSVFRYPIGSSDGQQADFQTFLALLDAVPGRLKVSPGPGGLGFVGFVTVTPSEAPTAKNFATDVEVEFTGRDILPSKVLGAF